MKKLKFLSFFAALSLLITPSSRADVIGPKLCARLKNESVYKRLKTDLENDITLALPGTTPALNNLLLELFGAYCLIVAGHLHWAPIRSCSIKIPGLPRSKMPKDVSKAFALQKRIHKKFPKIVPCASVLQWSYARYHYVCNPDIVYDQLPELYREKSLKWVKEQLLSVRSDPPTKKIERRIYQTWPVGKSHP